MIPTREKLAIATSLSAAGLLLVQANAASLILNGDFEYNTAGSSQFNVPNAPFSSLISSVTGFGARQGIDILTAGSGYGVNPQNGNWKLALASDAGGNTEAFSMELSSPATVGLSYSVSYYFEALSAGSFNGGTVELGLSTTANSFGTLVSISSPSTPGWTQRFDTFIAPISGNYLTLRLQTINSSWVGVDNFSLVAVPEPSSALLLGLGALTCFVRCRKIK